MDIIKNIKVYITISILIIALGIIFMIVNKNSGKGIFNYDIQFTGGSAIEINIGREFENDEIETLYKDTLNIDNPTIQKIGDGTSANIKTHSLTQDESNAIVEALTSYFEIDSEDLSVRDISATISNEIKRTSVLAILFASLAMLIYISFRFKDFKVGFSSIMALLHDILIVLAFYAIFRIPLNESFIAAILTVLGYSINATIIIFDKMRENKKLHPSKSNKDIINLSINQSIRRSVFTSLTTFLTVIALCIVGVYSIRIFTLPIAVGIVCGTYSSIFIAGSIWYITCGISKKAKN